MTAHVAQLADHIRRMPRQKRRVEARVLLTQLDRDPDLDELYRLLGMALWMADDDDDAAIAHLDPPLLLGDLPAEAADDIAAIERADRDRIAGWPSIDLPDPEGDDAA